MSSPFISELVRSLARLPGIGPRSARRLALHLLSNREKTMFPLIQQMARTAEKVTTCSVCGNLDEMDPCEICSNPKRNRSLVCVVQGIPDLWAIERTRLYDGVYHILGGVLSALDGVRPDDLSIGELCRRAANDGVEEIILALSATVDGQTTAHYIADRLTGAPVRITRLAQGVPVGGELDYLDDGTLIAALRSRSRISG